VKILQKVLGGLLFFDSHCIVITAWFLHPLSSTLMQHTNQAATHYDSIGTCHLSRRHIQYYDKWNSAVCPSGLLVLTNDDGSNTAGDKSYYEGCSKSS